MNKTSLIIIAIIVLIGGWFIASQNAKDTSGVAGGDQKVLALGGQEMTVYKTATCGCCHVYAEYLKDENVNTKVVDVEDLGVVKQEHGVPEDLQSCHTSMIGGYFVEGHIPLEVIEKLLAEKPMIKGIALPGMPSGSPGMPGPKSGQWTIFAVGNDGAVSEFMKY